MLDARRRVASVGRAARARRRELPRAARLPASSARAFYRREADGGRHLERRGGRRPRGHRRAAAHREARAQGDGDGREPDRRPSLRDRRRDRPDLLDERHDRHAELHPAHGGRSRELGDRLGAQLRGVRRRPGERIVSTYNAGPFVAGAALAAFDRVGLCHIPVGTGNTDRLMLAIELLQAGGGGAHAVVRRLRDRVGRGARHRSSRLERQTRARRGRARGRRAGVPREARGGLGREGHRGDGHRRHRPVALGRVRGAGRHAPRRARLRARRADRSRDGQRDRAGGRRDGRARADPSAASRGAAPALPHARPRARPARARARAAAPPRACAASGAPTTC